MDNLDAIARIMVLEAAVNRILQSSDYPPAIEQGIRTALSVESAGFVRSLTPRQQQAFYRYEEAAIGRLSHP